MLRVGKCVDGEMGAYVLYDDGERGGGEQVLCGLASPWPSPIHPCTSPTSLVPNTLSGRPIIPRTVASGWPPCRLLASKRLSTSTAAAWGLHDGGRGEWAGA